MLKPAELERILDRVFPAAEALGLNVGHIHFQLVSPEDIQVLASQGGMPVRYRHWSFGKQHQRLKTAYDFRLTQIYELVINHDPTYAFIDRTVSPAQAMMIAAHVAAHADFFRENRMFWDVPRQMATDMARHRRMIDGWRTRYGLEAVESLIDAGHILADFTGESAQFARPGERADDVLGYVAREALHLAEWERQLLSLLRHEARYIWPQLLTKVANEGYATFCHTALLREMELTPPEMWETARLNAQIVAVNPPQLNPYRLGYLLFQQAYLRGGWPEVFRARQLYDDVGLVRAYFDPALAERAGLAVYAERDGTVPPRTLSGTELAEALIRDLDHAGIPRIRVEEAQSHDGVLALVHQHDGRDLDFAELPFALKTVSQRIWHGPIKLWTVRQRVPHMVSHNGQDWLDHVV
jgi:stage V sporulation protein R